MHNILITGANSFVGQNFIHNTRYKHVNDVCLKENKPAAIDFSGVDVVIHVAAIVHQSKKIPEEEYYRVNRDLCLKVAKYAKKSGIKQFIFISTVKVYGGYNPSKRVWNETSICEPDDPYGKSKYEAEKGLKRLEDSNFIVSIVRPPLIYGIGVKANMLSIIKLVENFSILPLGNIRNKRSFSAIENLVELIDKVIEKKASGIFIPMDEKPLSTTELTLIIAKCLNKKIFLFPLPGFLNRLGNKLLPKIFTRLYGSLEFDNSLTRKKLRYNPVITSEAGIKKMVDAYLMKKAKM